MHDPHSAAESPQPFRGPVTWRLDLASGELRSSPGRARLMGFDPRSVTPTAHWWDQTLHPDDRPAVQLTRQRALQGTDGGYRSEYRAQRQDGQWLWLLEIGCIEYDGSGAATTVSGVLLDITREREAQSRLQYSAAAALRSMEDRLAIAASTANLGLWDVDLRTGQGWHNDRCWTMLGYEPHEGASGITQWLAMIHPDDLAPTIGLMQEQREKGGDFRAEYRMRAKDGSWRWIQCFGRTVAGSDPNAPSRMAGVQLDVTERREAEMRSHAAERLESVGRLAAGVAHEINTPVQFVSDSIHFVRDGLHELLALTERMRRLAARDQCNANSVAALSTHLPYLVENLPKALERSLDGLRRVSEIVSSMRELAHPNRPEMSSIDVNHVVQNALVLARSEYKHVADIETDLKPLPPVRGHAGELNQVLLNLLVNASHAISDMVGDSQRKGLIRISTRVDGDCVLISVSDSGCGIPAEIGHRVFEPFFTTKDVGRGTGQGLAISHNIIVKRHGGSIDFDSAGGQGTVFHVRLPHEGDAREQVA